ncbi:MAG TPA: hypothetical protein VH619_15635 [Verrucomicrobiae bacterium]|nr:hypothetical protein [Verrucomicrobiae bacterium]
MNLDVCTFPFYKIYHRNYEVYWNQFTPDQWQAGEENPARSR